MNLELGKPVSSAAAPDANRGAAYIGMDYKTVGATGAAVAIHLERQSADITRLRSPRVDTNQVLVIRSPAIIEKRLDVKLDREVSESIDGAFEVRGVHYFHRGVIDSISRTIEELRVLGIEASSATSRNCLTAPGSCQHPNAVVIRRRCALRRGRPGGLDAA